MPIIIPESLTARGWKEYYTGFPADLFFAPLKTESPWEVMPHLHLNYAMGGELQSLTFKNSTGNNVYFFYNNNWQLGDLTMIDAEAIKKEVAFISNLV
jgi:hypothetical protein